MNPNPTFSFTTSIQQSSLETHFAAILQVFIDRNLINQSINQQIKKPTNKSITNPKNQSIKQLINLSINQPNNHFRNQSRNFSNKSTVTSITLYNQPINRSVNQSINQSIYQLKNYLLTKATNQLINYN